MTPSARVLRLSHASNYGWTRMHRTFLTACALGLAALALPRTALAEEVPVAVLTVQTLDAFEQADSFSSALRRVIEDQAGWSTAQLDKDYALLVLVSTLECSDPPDAACEQKIASELKVDRFVWGNMKLDGGDVVGDLHFWAKGEPSRMTPFRYSANLKTAGDDTLMEVVRKTFLDLVGGQPKAKLTVNAGSSTGTLFVDGKEVGRLVGGVVTIEVDPGSHKITVKIPGYADSEAVLDVGPRENKSVTLTPSPPVASVDVKIVLGFVSLGLGAVAAGAGAYGGISALQLNGDDYDDYRKALTEEGPEDPYPENEQGCPAEPADPGAIPKGGDISLGSFCAREATAELLQSILYPAAGAFGLTGVILLAMGDWGEDAATAASLRVTPIVGSNHAFITVTGTLD